MTAKTTSAFLLALASLALSPSMLWAQQQEDWEGYIVKEIVPGEGWRRQRLSNLKGKMKAHAGRAYTAKERSDDTKALFATGLFERVDIKPRLADDRTVIVVVHVVEYALVESVTFKGNKVYSDAQLKTGLRVTPGSQLDPFSLQQDQRALETQYTSKGYYFSKVELVKKDGVTGYELTWNITEGPKVGVKAIEFSGNAHIDASDLRKYMASKENGMLLFIPTGKEPFIKDNIAQDIERIKLWYRLEGYLDIYAPAGRPERVFLEDLTFTDDKENVILKYHIDEGNRYKISDIAIRWEKPNHLFDEEEVRSWLISKPGEYYTENNASRDIRKIRDKYGERAYIMAEVTFDPRFIQKGDEVKLWIEIKENEKMYVGKITVQGNTKTRDDVVRRDFTRVGFLPGEAFNSVGLQRAVNRLRNTQWFGGADPADFDRGVTVTHEQGSNPNERDVVVDVREAQTGSVKFAAGFSSAFGVLGLIELSQRNFDLVKWPKSFSDITDGTAWAGGGQSFRIRAMPAQRRQSYIIDFREPYVFGYEFGMGVQGYSINTNYRDWTEKRLGVALSVDKWFDPFRLSLTYNAYQITIGSISDNAPLSIQDLAGDHVLISLAPSIAIDTRDSPVFPTEGARVSLTYEHAGQGLGGSFNFGKWTFQSEFFFPIHETESHLKHVLSVAFVTGFSYPGPGTPSMPVFERFYAGGRGSIRGFDYRGAGPHENGVTVGGDAYVFGSIEYTFPLITEVLRGAFFFDLANLTAEWDDLRSQKWRNTIGIGVRIIIPQLSAVPVALDFGFPLSKDAVDDTAIITFDVGRTF